MPRSRGLRLYPAQEEAILELALDRHLVLSTPTGTGKSLVAIAAHAAALAQGQRSFYTAPLKALVSEGAAVWVGFDDGTPLRMSSGEAAVPLWGAFMSKVPHKQEDIAAPQGVSVMDVEAATGKVWQQGCGPAVTEAFLSGTEPRDPCGGVYDPYGTLSIYMEPGIYNDSMAAAMYPDDTITSRVEAVTDPDLAGMPDLDTAEVSVDTADIEPEPVAPPPEVKPPEIKPPTPPPTDTTVDSLSTERQRPGLSLLSTSQIRSSSGPRTQTEKPRTFFSFAR